ncbi:unnamed protein product [Caenorhabditis brenneri]
MHFLWFLWDHLQIVFLLLLPYSLIQCKSKKKFQGDSRVVLVDQNNVPANSQAKTAHRPISQAVPKEMPLEKTKMNVTDDTLAGVASIAPDVSTGAPPKPKR